MNIFFIAEENYSRRNGESSHKNQLFNSKKTTGSLRSSSFFYFQTVSDFINENNDLEDNFYSPQVHLFI